MTTESIIILATIVSAFVLFGSVLAWADFYTQGARKSGIVATARKGPHDSDEERRAA